jgi:hypothetical protein
MRLYQFDAVFHALSKYELEKIEKGRHQVEKCDIYEDGVYFQEIPGGDPRFEKIVFSNFDLKLAAYKGLN